MLIAHSYRADIILMLNRGFRRLTVSGGHGDSQSSVDITQVSLDEIRTHNRQLADGYRCSLIIQEPIAERGPQITLNTL